MKVTKREKFQWCSNAPPLDYHEEETYNQTMTETKVHKAFRSQRSRSAARGIGFHFTFEEWTDWWQANLGDDWQSKRGTKKDQFVMARKHDKGDYEPNNIRCILCTDNHKECVSTQGEKNGFAKLTVKQVIEIFHSPKNYHLLAEEYNTTRSRIYRIKTKRVWQSVTVSL